MKFNTNRYRLGIVLGAALVLSSGAVLAQDRDRDDRRQQQDDQNRRMDDRDRRDQNRSDDRDRRDDNRRVDDRDRRDDNRRVDDRDRRDDNRRMDDRDHHDQGRAGYRFRAEDRDQFSRHYDKDIRRWREHPDRRHEFRAGARIPDGVRLRAVPPSYYRTLPPPPPGYRFGYYDGYVVAYDPTTQIIADVLDLVGSGLNR